jgi:hypothetical protein
MTVETEGSTQLVQTLTARQYPELVPSQTTRGMLPMIWMGKNVKRWKVDHLYYSGYHVHAAGSKHALAILSDILDSKEFRRVDNIAKMKLRKMRWERHIERMDEREVHIEFLVQHINWKADCHSACQEVSCFLKKPEGSLPCSYKTATGPYHEPAEFSSPHRSLSR